MCIRDRLLSNNAFSLEGLIPTRVIYSWRARSLDDAGNSLGYSSIRYLTLTDSDSEGASDAGEGCMQTRTRDNLPIYLLALIIALWTRRRYA